MIGATDAMDGWAQAWADHLPSALAGVAVFLLIVAVVEFVAARQTLARRLGTGRKPAQAAAVRPGRDSQRLTQIEALVTPTDPVVRGGIRDRLAQAGYRHPVAVRLYFLVTSLCGLVMAVAVATALPVMMRNRPSITLLALALGLTFLAFRGPSLWLALRIRSRRMVAMRAFPDTLDMLVVCIEAGLGFDQALNRVAGEVRSLYPAWGEELAQLCEELRAGKERAVALRDFSTRVGIEEVTLWVSVLIQADRVGVSVAGSMRVYAVEMRNKRLMRAEEVAHRMPMKIALTAVFLCLPATFIILAGPSMVILARSLSSFGR